MVVNGQELAPGKWTTLDDGTVVYCPLEITEDTSVVFNHAGSGGAEAWEYRADYNQPDTIVVLYPSANPEYTAQINEAMEGVVNQLYEGTGITPPDPIRGFWSASDLIGFESTKDYIEKHPGCDPQVIYAIDLKEDWDRAGSAFNQEMIDTLIQNGTTVVAIEPAITDPSSATVSPFIPSGRITSVEAQNIDGTSGTYYLPTNLVKLSGTGVNVAVMMFPDQGTFNNNHGFAEKLFLEVVVPNVKKNGETEHRQFSNYSCGGTIVNFNTNPDDYTWGYLKDGVFYETSFGEYLKTVYSRDRNSSKNTPSDKNDDNDKDKEKDSPLHKPDRDGETVSVDYDLVDEYVCAIGMAIGNTNLLSQNGVYIPPDGSQTFAAANLAFEDYSDMSKSFLFSLNTTCQNILTIAKSMSELDNNLAESLGEGTMEATLNEMKNLDLSVYRDFYSKDPNLDILMNADGDIKISRAKLIEASSTGNALINALMQDINDTNSVQKELMDFASETTSSLTGEAWDTVRGVVNEYSEICQDKQQYAEHLITGMISAYNKLLEYMQYDELDTSKIPETRQELTNLKTQLEGLETALASASEYVDEFSGYDKDGNATYVRVPNPLIPQLEKAIELCKEVIAEAERYLEQLEGLKDIDNASADEIKDVEQEQPQLEEETKANIEAPTVDAREDMDVKDLSSTISGAMAGMGITGLGEATGTVADKVANDIVNDIKQNQVTKEEEQKENSNKDINNNITNNSGGGSSNNNYVSEPQEEIPQEDNDYNDFPDYNDVVTNDNQLVYNVNNECKLIVKHDGENVNGVEFYYDFHDKATADNMYSQVLDKYQDISGFDKIVQYEGYLKVLFNEEYYGGQTVEAFKEVYSQYYNLV